MLTKITRKKIDRELKKFPIDQKQSAIIAALQIIQTENSFLTDELIAFAADYLATVSYTHLTLPTIYSV